MKKTFLILTLTTFVAGTMTTSCQTTTKKEITTSKSKEVVMRDSIEADYEVAVQEQKAARAEDWQAFKDKTDAAIDANENRIAEFKVQMKKTGKAIDDKHSRNIEILEKRNKDLKIRMKDFKNDTSSDWDKFKTELGHDVDELDQAIKDFTVNNKN